MDDFRLKDLRVQIDPQSGADSIENAAVETVAAHKGVVDTGAALTDVAVTADTGGIILNVAGRPQPPPAVATAPNAISNCIIRRLTLSCTIGAEILIDFCYTE